MLTFRTASLLGFLGLAAVTARPAPALSVSEPTLQARLGYDTNALGAGTGSSVLLSPTDTLTWSAGGGFSLVTPGSKPAVKLGYTGEVLRFDRQSSENHSTHRLALAAQTDVDAWKFTADASALYVAGSRTPPVSALAINANAISLWRERRRQVQTRAKLQAQHETGSRVLRLVATWLGQDYHTAATSGRFAFADRSDLQAGAELGWRVTPDSLWLLGLRAGHQEQAIVPLPNCEFDYSSRYHRFTAAWETRLSPTTSLSVAAGPDFRRYTGAIDPRVVPDRNRTSLWFDATLSSKPVKNLTLAAKATQMQWLSSTGKSAYTDTCAEASAVWNATADWSLRGSAKVHRCDYYPVVRDDWESLVGLGVTRRLSARASLTVDVLRHRGWNDLAGGTGREFNRTVLSLGTTLRL